MAVIFVDTSYAQESPTMDIFDTIANGELADVQQIIAQPGFNIEQRNDKQHTPLLLAAWMGKYAAMNALIEKGADLDVYDSGNNTVLHYLCMHPPGDIDGAAVMNTVLLGAKPAVFDMQTSETKKQVSICLVTHPLMMILLNI